jgi:hypothetical protein
VEDQVTSWTRAELAGDTRALDALLHPEFIGVGPFGFVLDRRQWSARFAEGLTYTAFGLTFDTQTRVMGETAFVVGTQTQSGDHRGQRIDGAFRVSLVFTGADWLLTSLHLSLRYPPGSHPDQRSPKESPA